MGIRQQGEFLLPVGNFPSSFARIPCPFVGISLIEVQPVRVYIWGVDNNRTLPGLLESRPRASAPITKGEVNMLSWSIFFLIVALVAALLGFGGIAGAAAGIAKILFLIFLVLFVVSLLFGRRGVI